MTIWWLSYPLLGIFGGFVAGLFGVGGGLTLVPFMYMLFVAQNFPPIMRMAPCAGMSCAVWRLAWCWVPLVAHWWPVRFLPDR